jgi:hypothetical protein
LLPPFLLSTGVTIGEHSICFRKGKGGYGIRPQPVEKVYARTGGRGKVVAFSERRGVCNGDAVACKLYAVTFGDG